ncbi:MAG: hypothetical protein IJC43_10520 [Clostridia bacterium]|nr:hypothetical protein [Clostridia bacterium]
MKKHFAFALLSALLLTLFSCSADPKTFVIEGAQRLSVMSGTTGERIELTSAEDIAYLTDNIGALSFSKGDKVNGDGWSYSLCWYDESGKELETVTLLGDGVTIVFDGRYYQSMSIDEEIDLAFLEGKFAEAAE